MSEDFGSTTGTLTVVADDAPTGVLPDTATAAVAPLEERPSWDSLPSPLDEPAADFADVPIDGLQSEDAALAFLDTMLDNAARTDQADGEPNLPPEHDDLDQIVFMPTGKHMAGEPQRRSVAPIVAGVAAGLVAVALGGYALLAGPIAAGNASATTRIEPDPDAIAQASHSGLAWMGTQAVTQSARITADRDQKVKEEEEKARAEAEALAEAEAAAAAEAAAEEESYYYDEYYYDTYDYYETYDDGGYASDTSYTEPDTGTQDYSYDPEPTVDDGANEPVSEDASYQL